MGSDMLSSPWPCDLCSSAHHGAEPPETCPVGGDGQALGAVLSGDMPLMGPRHKAGEAGRHLAEPGPLFDHFPTLRQRTAPTAR